MRALISVSDKTNIVNFAKELHNLGVDIISTGGTYKTLEEHLQVREVSEITGFKECLDGRVKTLHPIIHAGILAKRDNPKHMQELSDLTVTPIDFVIVNLYPFKKVVLNNPSFEEAIENIDIGGPTMLRSAAKNYRDVVVIVDPNDYDLVIRELRENKKVSLETRYYLMTKVFHHTAAYDALIAKYFRKESYPEELTLVYEKVQEMRYGENPHQSASFYKEIFLDEGTLPNAIQHGGKELSFNNINDTNGALELLKEFEEPTVVACKHGNPCGVGSADDIYTAWEKAFSADNVSIFGGIVVLNRELTLEIAKEMNKIFLEVVVAPSYEEKALDLLKSKKNLRILEIKNGISEKQTKEKYDVKKINGGIIIQSIDDELILEDIRVVTKLSPNKKQMED
ncbi:MAG: bifunctional phosphoribosylaminoimidazolecarboxamide formyltransferase/IMP cyclohydrolase, partial [Bacilli bacterium]|nr:bifunctional phosphoribosylaminoimidazolecarboxamide formyltransferase/IMP cyclohydrolase [Bacilli bacterium]